MTFEELMAAHEGMVSRYVHRSIRDGSAEDVMQEVWLKAWLRLPQLKEEDKAKRWLLKIAKTVCLDHHREVQCRPKFVEGDLVRRPDDSNVEAAAAHRMQLADVSRVLRNISHYNASCLALFGYGYSGDEIGERMGTSKSAAFVACTRARHALRVAGIA